MDIISEPGVFAAYAGGILLLFFFGKLLWIPLKLLMKLLLSSLAGGVVIIALSVAGKIFGIFVPVNPMTAVITGILGLPGAAGVILFCNILHIT